MFFQNAKKIKKIAKEKKVNFFYPDDETVTISINETTSIRDINYILSVFAESAKKETFVIPSLSESNNISKSIQRTTDFLTLDVFNSYHSETELMRYIKSLERKDLSLNHSMISLGSCTMKLNAASEMLPLSNPQWGNIHPFVPLNQAEGYQIVLNKISYILTYSKPDDLDALISELSDRLLGGDIPLNAKNRIKKSILQDKNEAYWKEAIDEYKNNPNEQNKNNLDWRIQNLLSQFFQLGEITLF